MEAHGAFVCLLNMYYLVCFSYDLLFSVCFICISSHFLVISYQLVFTIPYSLFIISHALIIIFGGEVMLSLQKIQKYQSSQYYHKFT